MTSSPSTPTRSDGFTTPQNLSPAAAAAAQEEAALTTPPSDEAPGMPATPERPKQRLEPARLFASGEANGPSSPTQLPRRPVLRLLSQGRRNYASTSAAAEATSAAASAAASATVVAAASAAVVAAASVAVAAVVAAAPGASSHPHGFRPSTWPS